MTRKRTTRTSRSTPSRGRKGKTGKGFGAAWNSAARGAGRLVRATGSTRELEVPQQRDSIAFGLLVSASLIALATWFHLGGPLGQNVDSGLRRLLGVLVVALPGALGFAGITLMVTAARGERRPGLIIGSILTTSAVAGFCQLVLDDNPAQDGDVSAAGGLLGYFTGELPARTLTPWLTVPLILAAFILGSLLLGNIPMSKVRACLRELLVAP